MVPAVAHVWLISSKSSRKTETGEPYVRGTGLGGGRRRIFLGLCRIGHSQGFSLGMTQSGIPLVTFKERISSPSFPNPRLGDFARGGGAGGSHGGLSL